MSLVIAWRTTKLIEGGHRGLQANRPIYVITYTFLRFLRFFQNPKNVTFTFFAVFHTFSRTMIPTEVFDQSKLEESIPGDWDNYRQTKWQYSRFGRRCCHFRLSVVVAITWRHLYRARHGRKSWICCWNFDAICHISRDTTISQFGGHITISGCRPLLESLADTFPTFLWSYTPDLQLEFQLCLS